MCAPAVTRVFPSSPGQVPGCDWAAMGLKLMAKRTKMRRRLEKAIALWVCGLVDFGWFDASAGSEN